MAKNLPLPLPHKLFDLKSNLANKLANKFISQCGLNGEVALQV